MKKRAAKKPLSTSVPGDWNKTPEEWRAMKRTEWGEVRRALDRFYYGSAYVPAGQDLHYMMRAAERITEAMQEEWVIR